MYGVVRPPCHNPVTVTDRLDLVAVCIARAGGLRAGRRMAQFITEWEVAVRANGGPVSADDFAGYWRESRMTSFRRLAEFRNAFPELGPQAFPHALMAPLLERLAAGDEHIPDLGVSIA